MIDFQIRSQIMIRVHRKHCHALTSDHNVTCSTCESSSSTSKNINNFNIRPPCVTIAEEAMPLMNVKWPVNNGGFVGIEIEDAL
jgi:hypothetical protein